MSWTLVGALRCSMVAGVLASVAGCGGGGDSNGAGASPTSSQSLAGRWSGSVTSLVGSARAETGGVSVVTLPDGTAWVIYPRNGQPGTVGGVARGGGMFLSASTLTGPAVNSNFEFGYVQAEGGLVVEVTPKQGVYAEVKPCLSSVCGSFAMTINARYEPDYERPPNLVELAGTFTGTLFRAGASDAATFRLTDDGSLSGTSAAGCTYSGTLQPRTDGNTYDVAVSSSGEPCTASSGITGIAYMDKATQALTVASTAFAFRGNKP